MLHRTVDPLPAAAPLRPSRVLIEDPQLPEGTIEAAHGLEITICSGPEDELDACPLVMDGSCPLGPIDVVVHALEGPWAKCVHTAWARTATPVVDASDVTSTDPDERVRHHLGAAMQRLWVGSPGVPLP